MQELSFSSFVLRPYERQLLSDGKVLPIGARAFDVLRVLAHRAGDLVTKNELLEQVWPGLVVEENNLQVHISTLRKLLGASHIATVAGQGYRFTGRVSLAARAADASAPSASPALATSASRAIAVLPFANLSGSDDQEYFSDGLADDIISKLTRSPWLYVIARNSSFSMRAADMPLAEACRALGARYVVSGSVRRSAKTMRISAQLIDGPSGQSLWAEKFDRPIDDLFDVQEAIAASIVGAIEPVYLRREELLTSTLAAPDMRTWDWLMRGRWHFWRSSREHLAHAQRCAANALEIKPNDPASLCLMAFTHMSLVWAGWSDKPNEAIVEAARLALRAVRENDTDANAHFTLGTALSFTGDYGQAIAELRHALTLYPEFAAAAGELGRLLAFTGATQEAAEYVLQAIDASPQDQHLSLWLRTRAIASYIDGDYPAAARYAVDATARRPDWFFNYYCSAACLAAAGDLPAARRAVDQAKTFGPYPLRALRAGHPFADRKLLDQFVGHLSLAGWEG